MATQGIVSILNNSEMFFKVVAGSNGFNASKVVEWARTHKGVMTIEEVYNAAIKAKFGDPSDLIVQGSDGSHAYDGDKIDGVDGLYRDYSKFLDPNFNPRWEAGTADFVEVIHLAS